MKLIVLVTPGRKTPGIEQFYNLGYEVEYYCSTQDTSTLTDSEESKSEEFLHKLGSSIEKSENRSHVRSLRASFAKMITDDIFNNDDDIIFCEQDAVPRVHSDILKDAINRVKIQFPDFDIFRPYNYGEFDQESYPQEIKDPLQVNSLERYDGNDSVYYGTHALYIPLNKRKKIAKLFTDYRLPIDVAIQMANYNGDINVITCDKNAFVQGVNSCRRDIKLAVMMTSYKRLDHLQRQIYSMMDQSYKDFHLFVSVKGVSDFIYNTMVKNNFQHFIDEGRLTINLSPNRNQLSNRLDTIRDCDIDQYDQFLTVDDDDFYSRTYIQSIIDYHGMYSQPVNSYNDSPDAFLNKLNQYDVLDKVTARVRLGYGFQPVMTREIIDLLFLYEQDPTAVINLLGHHTRHKLSRSYCINEDYLIFSIMQYVGVYKRNLFSQTYDNTTMNIINIANPSVVRGGGYISSEYYLKKIGTNPKLNNIDQYVVSVYHRHWNNDSIVIKGSEAMRANNLEKAEVKKFENGQLTIFWPSWNTTETFIKNKEGLYELK